MTAKQKKYFISAIFFIIIITINYDINPYPIDGYAYTGIHRLERLRFISEKIIDGTTLPPGGLKKTNDIALNLLDSKIERISDLIADPDLQKKIETLFSRKNPNYNFAVLDITPGREPRFASVNGDKKSAPASVGKLAIAAGLFTELKTFFPDDIGGRQNLLRSRIIKADEWVMNNHHPVPIFDPDTKEYQSRPVRIGDTFTLYEWLDHMISASSNAAASIVWKEVILMRAFGAEYPPSEETETKYFKETPVEELKQIAVTVVNDPLRAMDIGENEWKLGTFFTSTGNKIIPGEGSYAIPLAFLQFLVNIEKGRMVDEWSSLELKRMMYLTARRIRYVLSPELNDAAVYFKSGSQYKCKPEPGFTCIEYMGNVENYMNAAAIIEHPDGTTYMIALMSNILKINSADDHTNIATRIDRIIREQKIKPPVVKEDKTEGVQK